MLSNAFRADIGVEWESGAKGRKRERKVER